jgi:hypothetical protein
MGAEATGAVAGTVFGGFAAWMTTLFFFGVLSTGAQDRCTTGDGAGAAVAGDAAAGDAAAAPAVATR